MTKGAYVGVGGVARKIKKGYVGVDGKARKIKKAYIGVGGVARPCWGGEELKYYGVVTHLSEGRASLAATTVGGYALFGGGEAGDFVPNTAVDAYTTSLVHSTPAPLSCSRESFAATTVGNYALFGGGSSSRTVEAYTESLVLSNATSLSSAREGLAATTVGGYALFGGGGDGAAMAEGTVDAYTTSLVRSTPAPLSEERDDLAATTVGNYALFGGGDGGAGGPVDAYTTSLVHSTTASRTEGRSDLAATTVGGYALFGGGLYKGSAPRASTYISFSGTVDAYTTSLVRSTATSLSSAREGLAATTVGGYALFGGGFYEGGSARATGVAYSATVDAYTTSLVHSTTTSLSEGRGKLAATTVGGYALFGGGDYNSGALPGTGKSDAVDAYTAPPLKTGTLRIKTVWGVIAYYGDETVEDEQAVSLPINANNLKVTAVYYEIPTYTDIVSTNVSWTSQPGRKTEGVAWVLDPTKDASIVWAD